MYPFINLKVYIYEIFSVIIRSIKISIFYIININGDGFSCVSSVSSWS